MEKIDWNGNGGWKWGLPLTGRFQYGALLHWCLMSLWLGTLRFTLFKNVSLSSSTVAGESSSPHSVGN